MLKVTTEWEPQSLLGKLADLLSGSMRFKMERAGVNERDYKLDATFDATCIYTCIYM